MDFVTVKKQVSNGDSAACPFADTPFLFALYRQQENLQAADAFLQKTARTS
jgi:hypothetical protein